MEPSSIVIDDFLSTENFNKLNELIVDNSSFPWYYQNSVSYKGYHETHYQFVHSFYKHPSWKSNFGDFLLPCLDQLGVQALLRIKANLLVKTESHIEHGFHIDHSNCKTPYKTAILYLNTNNGYTLFEDGTKVKSEANRMLVFDGSMMHTGATCTDKKVRIVINFNFFI